MKRFTLLVLTAAAVLMMAAPCFAEGQDGPPPGTIGSGSITIEQIQKDIVQYTAERNGIKVFFVLPRGWELKEEGLDKAGKLLEGVPAYLLLSRAPVAKPDDPTDLVFELHVYEQRLPIDGITDKDGKKVDQKELFRGFLDAQLNQALGRGWKVLTEAKDIVPKPYGPENRPYGQTPFVPIFFETKEGAKLYTFTSVAEDTVWMLRFLVTKDQTENYGALIALILDNTFALTDAQYTEVEQRQAAALKKLEQEGKAPKQPAK